MKDSNLLLVIGGIGTGKWAYQKIKHTAPLGWDVKVVGPADLIFDGDFNLANERIDKLIVGRGFSRVYLLGHSLGGILAINYASRHPEKIGQLVLVDSEGINGKENILRAGFNFLADNLFDAKRATKEKGMALITMLRQPALYLRLAQLAQYGDMTREAGAIRTPTLIIWGGRDRLIPLWKAQKLRQLIPNSKLTVLKDLDHHWIHYLPEKLWQSILPVPN